MRLVAGVHGVRRHHRAHRLEHRPSFPVFRGEAGSEHNSGRAPASEGEQPMTAQLECRQLNKTLGGKRVLADLNLDVREGEVVSLLGASGSGKTTLLRMISG